MDWVVDRWGSTKNTCNDNGIRLHEEAAQLKLCEAGSMVRKTFAQRWTILFPTAERKKRIYDHILVSFKDRGKVRNMTVARDTLHESDHCLVTMDMKVPHIKNKGLAKPSSTTRKLRSAQMAGKMELELENLFSVLESKVEELDDRSWNKVQETIVRTAEKVKDDEMPFAHSAWISDLTLELVKKRALLKQKMLEAETEEQRLEDEVKWKASRREVRISAKKDKRDWLRGVITDIEKAGNTGDSRKVFEGVRKLAGRRGSPPASLDGIDSQIWVKFFTNLLGKKQPPEEAVPTQMKELEAWKVCTDSLQQENHRPMWEVDMKEPDEEEVMKTLQRAAKGKSVSGIIPTEFWLNSRAGRRILTLFIGKVWRGDAPPKAWLDAALCLLYKQKGSKADPGSYRGISLLSSAEKIISMIILNRIKTHLDKALHASQAGFTTGKSCRNAVFVLLREIERSCQEGTPLLYNFVDFRKAFDSLDWSTMWRVMEAQGMPKKLVDIIRQLYEQATISVRLNMEGGTAEPFRQKVGIRQGCSLSPAIFVLVLDFAMRAFTKACTNLGMEADAVWLGYADDLAIRSGDVKTAECVFHQLQAACAFVGLHCNTGKTECMARGICKPEITEEMACKERVLVSFSNGKFEGWIADWAARGQLADKKELKKIESSARERTDFKPSHIIVYDDGEKVAVEILAGGNGWLVDHDGDKHRFKRLGSKEYVDAKKNKFRCQGCDEVFRSQRAVSSHARFCKKREDLTVEQQVRRRKTRELNTAREGLRNVGVESVQMKDFAGQLLKAVAEFRYLGTLVTSVGGATKEIIRRLGIASTVFAQLGRIWPSDLPLSLKCDLYRALVMSILLYNGECWLLSERDLKRLEGFHFRCLRRITKQTRCPGTDDSKTDRASKKAVFAEAKMPEVLELIREKRLRWFGHLVRAAGEGGDPAVETLRREMEHSSGWWRQLLEDFKAKGITAEEAVEMAEDRAQWRQISSAKQRERRLSNMGVRVLALRAAGE